jgi:hypothetical protein
MSELFLFLLLNRSMRYCDILMEKRESPLYHAISFDHSVTALTNDELLGTTTQRYWPDGNRRKDNASDYNDSFWMKGISFTRDWRFAQSFNNVVFSLDQALLSNRYKIIPFNWGFSLPKGNHHKREREEFLVTKMTGSTFMEPEDPDDPTSGSRLNVKAMKAPNGKVAPLSRYLLGIYVQKPKHSFDTDYIEQIVNHPKFLGFYSPPATHKMTTPTVS